MSLVEKFQITMPAKIEGPEQFESFESVRVNNYVPEGISAKLNNTPTVALKDEGSRSFRRSYGGDDDVSGGVTAATLKDGFERKAMAGSDDLYDGEHIDLFYGEVKDENGNAGFVERNNYLDRN